MQRLNGRTILALLVMGVGVIALLNNFGYTQVRFSLLINLLWPLLVALAGINLIVQRQNFAGLVTGAVLTGLGVVFFGRNAGFFDINLRYFWQGFWPLLIILIGLRLLSQSESNSSGNLALMGAVEKNREGWTLKNEEYTAIMGGIELDIRKADFSNREVTLGLTAVMGGITVIVPEDVAVSCKGSALLGGIDLLGKGSGGIFGNTNIEIGDLHSAEKVIHLSCTCIMGGIEIKR